MSTVGHHGVIVFINQSKAAVQEAFLWEKQKEFTKDTSRNAKLSIPTGKNVQKVGNDLLCYCKDRNLIHYYNDYKALESFNIGN